MKFKKNFVYVMVIFLFTLATVCIISCNGGNGGDSTTYYGGGGNSGIDNDNDGYDNDVDCEDNDPDTWYWAALFLDGDTDGLADNQDPENHCVGDPSTFPEGWTTDPDPDYCLNDHDPDNKCAWPHVMEHWAYPSGTIQASLGWDCAYTGDPLQPWKNEPTVTGHDSSDGNEVIRPMNPEIWDTETRSTCQSVIQATTTTPNQCPWRWEEYYPSYNESYDPNFFCDDLALGSPVLYVDWDGICNFPICQTRSWEPRSFIYTTGPFGQGAAHLWDLGTMPDPDPDPGDDLVDVNIYLDYDSDGSLNKCPDQDNNGVQDDPSCIPDSCMMIYNPWSQDCGADGLCPVHAGYPGPDAGEADGLGGNDGIGPECFEFDTDNDGVHDSIDADPTDPNIQ